MSKFQFILIFIFLSFTGLVFTQESDVFKCSISHSKNDLDMYKLKGKIRSITEIHYKRKKLNPESNKYQFVKSNGFQFLSTTSKDTIATINTILFNEKGNLISVKEAQVYNGYAVKSSKEKCFYNESDDIKNISYYNQYSSKIEDWKFKGDSKTKILYISKKYGDGLNTYYKDMEFEFDKNGNIIKKILDNQTNTYAYNNSNDLVESTVTRNEEIILKEYYSYDKKGNLSLIKSGNDEYNLQYNDYGNKIASEKYDKIIYKYDSNGNWVSKEEASTSFDIKDKTIREINYYDEKSQLVKNPFDAFFMLSEKENSLNQLSKHHWVTNCNKRTRTLESVTDYYTKKEGLDFGSDKPVFYPFVKSSDTLIFKSEDETSTLKIVNKDEIIIESKNKKSCTYRKEQEQKPILINKLPIYPGCENANNPESIKNCLRDKLKEFISDNFDRDVFYENNISKDYVLFELSINVSKDGSIQLISSEVLGVSKEKKKEKLRTELKRVFNLFPKIQPAESFDGFNDLQLDLDVVFRFI